MKQKVSAETITELTKSADFADPASIPPQPSVDELIAAIHARIEAKYPQDHSAGHAAQSFRAANIKGEKARLQGIFDNIPVGFKVAPVYYKKPSAQYKDEVFDEYSFRVRPNFLRFLAENHAAALKELGICSSGIHRMRRGLDPARVDGSIYDVSIDHIIERSGSGAFVARKTIDPQAPEGQGAVSEVNHFNNLVLLPDSIHLVKNALNDMQRPSKMEEGLGLWMLMIVPTCENRRCGYVAPAQPEGSRYGGLVCRETPVKDRMHLLWYVTRQLTVSLEDIQGLGQSPRDRRKRAIHLDRYIKPLLTEVRDSCKRFVDHFNMIDKKSAQGRRDLDDLSIFMDGRCIRGLRKELDHVNLYVAMELRQIFSALDKITRLKPVFKKNAENMPKRPPRHLRDKKVTKGPDAARERWKEEQLLVRLNAQKQAPQGQSKGPASRKPFGGR